ncbi:MAG: pyridoxal-phosphate dependent enzyme, partial [Candidatus Aminicenantaceae bacterium]
KEEGFIQKLPTFIGVQARGCSPIAQAYTAGKLKVKRINKANTIAHSIANPDPPGGNMVLKLIQENKGKILDVSDEEILNAQKMLAELEGIFCQPASSTVLAGLLKLSEKEKFEVNDQIVLVATGGGLKTIKSLESFKIDIHQTSLSKLENTISSLAHGT